MLANAFTAPLLLAGCAARRPLLAVPTRDEVVLDVVDTDGGPIPDALVAIAGADGLAQAFTDAAGRAT